MHIWKCICSLDKTVKHIFISYKCWNVRTTQMTSSDSLHVLENVLTSKITHSYTVEGNIFCASQLTHSMSLKKYSTYIKKRLVLMLINTCRWHECRKQSNMFILYLAKSLHNHISIMSFNSAINWQPCFVLVKPHFNLKREMAYPYILQTFPYSLKGIYWGSILANTLIIS